jgi:hypothetical protein
MINTRRLLIAFVVVLVVANAYEFLVYGMLLNSFHGQFPNLLRPQAELPMLRMFLTGALWGALATVFYALFARGRASNLATGLVFGVFLGLLGAWIPQAYHKMLLINWPFYLHWAAAGFFESVAIGLALGLVYRE